MVRDCDIEEIRRGLDAACEISTVSGDNEILVPLEWWATISRRIESGCRGAGISGEAVGRLESGQAQVARAIERGARTVVGATVLCTAWLSFLLLVD